MSQWSERRCEHCTTVGGMLPKSECTRYWQQQMLDTCQTCRQYTVPPPSSAGTSRLTTSFNQIVQPDLLFVDSTLKSPEWEPQPP
eukprot:10278978-Prorocentrum_lima.AAC.1